MRVHSWHIPYAMNLGLTYVNDGMDGVGMRVKDHLIGGGQGVEVNAPRDGVKSTLILVCHG